MSTARRMLPGVFVLVLVLALTFVGGPATTVAHGQTPVKGGILRIALPAQPESFNPVLIGELSSSIVNHAVFASLTLQHPETLSIEPFLAERWEANSDITEWTFYLRDDVKWHDGTPFTAHDVKFTFERIIDPNENAQGHQDMRELERIEVVDDFTVRFVLRSPDGQFPDRLALGSFNPLPKHVLEGFDSLADAVDFNTRHPIGNGPFKFKEVRAGSHIELEAFEDYFLGQPYLDGLLFRIIPDMNVRVAQLRAGDIDWTDIEPGHAVALERDRRVEVLSVSSSRYPIADFAFKGPYAHLFEDPRVRIAMIHAVDQDSILQAVALGRGTPMNGAYIPPTIEWIPQPNITPYEYNPEKARQLLAEAGWEPDAQGYLAKDGQRFSFYVLVDRGNVQREQMGLILQQAWQELGMDVGYVAGERTGRWIEETRAGSFPVRLAEMPLAHPDWFRRIYHTEGPHNSRGYHNPVSDELMDRTLTTSDRDEQARLYQQAQEVMHEDPPVITFFLREQLTAIRSNVKNVPRGELKLSTPYTHLIWIDR